MASPAKTLESASRDELVAFVKKVEARRRLLEQKLKGKSNSLKNENYSTDQY
jgi:hypothetical protein